MNKTEINNDSDIIEIKTNEDVFNEMKLRNDIEEEEKKIKKKNLNLSRSSIQSNNSRSFNDDSETGSVVDIKNLGKNYKFDNNIFTLESLNSTEFKKDYNTNLNDSSCFYSQQDLKEFKINVKNSKI